VVFEPLLGELSGSSYVQRAAPRNGDFVTPTHDRPEIHTNDRTIMAANPAVPAEYPVLGLTATSS
jgi:hypothetical protein